MNAPTLCWSTVGHAVRSALAQGLHLATTHRGRNHIDAETGKRVWAGVVNLEATSAATLGLPPSLTRQHCLEVAPTPVNDDLIGETEVGQQPSATLSQVSFYCEGYKLFVMQLQVLHDLYGHSHPQIEWPDMHKVLNLDTELEMWKANLPTELDFNGRYEEATPLAFQRNVLRARFLNAKQLIHRPLLSKLCNEGRSRKRFHISRLTLLSAQVSSKLCCTAATELIEGLTGGPVAYMGAWCK